MERRFKGLVAINDVLDDRYQKLSDRYHDLELSHNRKKKCLFEILQYVKLEISMAFSSNSVVYVPIPVFQLMEKRIEDALFSDGRDVIDGKTGVQHRKKKITMATVKARKK